MIARFLVPLLGLALLAPGIPRAQTTGPIQNDADVEKLFASTCGWCHSDGGREKGKGPKLMGTQLTDGEIMYRIKTGKPGYMPAFGSSFKEDELRAIVHYIRGLQPRR